MGACVFPALTWCLLAFSVAVGQTEKGDFTVGATQPSVSNAAQTTLTTSSNSSVSTAFTSNVNEDTTTAFGSTTRDSQTTTHQQTAPSTTITTPLTSSPSLTTSTPAAHTPTATASTGHESTPGATAATSAGSPGAGSTTSHSVDKDTQGLGLNISERNLTIVFGVVLGLFAVSLVGFMFHRCRQRIQFMHQPLTNSDYTDAFGTDDDTLVISGGLYDGHPIDDNTPTAPDDQSQFRLEFIH